MIETVNWRSSVEEAVTEARELGKQVLVDLSNPG